MTGRARLLHRDQRVSLPAPAARPRPLRTPPIFARTFRDLAHPRPSVTLARSMRWCGAMNVRLERGERFECAAHIAPFLTPRSATRSDAPSQLSRCNGCRSSSYIAGACAFELRLMMIALSIARRLVSRAGHGSPRKIVNARVTCSAASAIRSCRRRSRAGRPPPPPAGSRR